MKKIVYCLVVSMISIIYLSGCIVQQNNTTGQVTPSSIEKFAQDTVFRNAFVGFSLLDEKTGKYMEELNPDKYFIPASNTKLFTTYAVLKYVSDSLPGFYFHETKDTLYFKPNGDPTFLYDQFDEQKAFNKMVKTNKVLVIEKVPNTGITPLGNGWAWVNYQSNGMVERSAMPIYGNSVKFKNTGSGIVASPSYFQKDLRIIGNVGPKMNVSRSMDDNSFFARTSNANILMRPFTRKTDEDIAYHLLQDTLQHLNKQLVILNAQKRAKDFWKPFYTHKTDEVLQPMMHQSNNFMAEQLLILAGSEMSGKLSDRETINSLVNRDLSFLSSKFVWYDGSGLSRYNHITPRAITELLVKMKKEFGWDRMAGILQKGDEGTVKGYYKGYEENIYTKTGTLGNNVSALSGYLITKKGNKYIFSFIANNQYKRAGLVRKAFEKYLVNLIESQ